MSILELNALLNILADREKFEKARLAIIDQFNWYEQRIKGLESWLADAQDEIDELAGD